MHMINRNISILVLMMVTLFATSSYANDCIDIRGPSNSFSRNDSLCNEDGTIKTKKVTKEAAKK